MWQNDGLTLQRVQPTRIVVSGYPALEGETLLEKRAYALEKQDHVRRR